MILAAGKLLSLVTKYGRSVRITASERGSRAHAWPDSRVGKAITAACMLPRTQASHRERCRCIRTWLPAPGGVSSIRCRAMGVESNDDSIDRHRKGPVWTVQHAPNGTCCSYCAVPSSSGISRLPDCRSFVTSPKSPTAVCCTSVNSLPEVPPSHRPSVPSTFRAHPSGTWDRLS